MSVRSHSGSGFFGFLLGVAAMAVVGLGVMMFALDGREGPIRSAELSIPIPELPDPPAVPPRSDASVPPAS